MKTQRASRVVTDTRGGAMRGRLCWTMRAWRGRASRTAVSLGAVSPVLGDDRGES